MQVADQMAITAGIHCDVDPLLGNVMKTHCGKWEGGMYSGREKKVVWVREGRCLLNLALVHSAVVLLHSLLPSIPYSLTHQTRARRTTVCGVCTLSSWQ